MGVALDAQEEEENAMADELLQVERERRRERREKEMHQSLEVMEASPEPGEWARRRQNRRHEERNKKREELLHWQDGFFQEKECTYFGPSAEELLQEYCTSSVGFTRCRGEPNSSSMPREKSASGSPESGAVVNALAAEGADEHGKCGPHSCHGSDELPPEVKRLLRSLMPSESPSTSPVKVDALDRQVDASSQMRMGKQDLSSCEAIRPCVEVPLPCDEDSLTGGRELLTPRGVDTQPDKPLLPDESLLEDHKGGLPCEVDCPCEESRFTVAEPRSETVMECGNHESPHAVEGQEDACDSTGLVGASDCAIHANLRREGGSTAEDERGSSGQGERAESSHTDCRHHILCEGELKAAEGGDAIDSAVNMDAEQCSYGIPRKLGQGGDVEESCDPVGLNMGEPKGVSAPPHGKDEAPPHGKDKAPPHEKDESPDLTWSHSNADPLPFPLPLPLFVSAVLFFAGLPLYHH